MINKKAVLEKANYKLPTWAVVTAIVLFVVDVIIDTSFILGYFLGLLGFFYAGRKAYSLARRLGKPGTLIIWICLYTNFIGLFVYWLYYKFLVRGLKNDFKIGITLSNAYPWSKGTTKSSTRTF